ncbi:MAG: hypothetical protein ACO289_11490 [Prochlorococcaceae cyanobacterium]
MSIVSAPLIGLYSSVPGSGKSTLAGILAAHGFVVLPFAGTIKRMLRLCLEDLGLSLGEIEEAMGPGKNEPLAALGGRTPRYAMQTLGTEWGRGLDPMLWTRAWRQQATAALKVGRGVVVDDMRFLSEAQMVRLLGGATVRVHRPEHAVDEVITAHASEGGLDLWAFDLDLHNDGSLEPLEEKAVALLQLMGRA